MPKQLLIDMLKDQRDYAWKYFSLHAEQRLKTFHFYIIISVVVLGATLTAINNTTKLYYVTPMCYLLAFFSYVFWKLDQRNRELIKHGENALKEIEGYHAHVGEETMPISIFTSEEQKTNRKKTKLERVKVTSYTQDHLSYSDCFNMVFFVFGMFGVILGTLLFIFSIV